MQDQICVVQKKLALKRYSHVIKPLLIDKLHGNTSHLYESMVSQARSGNVNVVQLARRVLRSSTTSKNKYSAPNARLFQELVAVIASTNPLPAMPRIPATYHGPGGGGGCGSTSSLEQELRLGRMLAPSSIPVVSDSIPLEQPPLNQANATYGTTPGASIQTLLSVLYPSDGKAKGAFVDAGSGQGIPTLAAALSGRFPLAKGIEYQTKWHQSAVALKEAYDESMEEEERQQQHPLPKEQARCQVEFLHGDMTKPAGHFVGASCVFLNGVTFDAKMCQLICHRLEEDLAIKTDSDKDKDDRDVFVVSMSRQLALASFDLVDILSLKANGESLFTFYVHRKAKSGSLHHATSDSETMRMLRDASTDIDTGTFGSSQGLLLDELVDMALVVSEEDDQSHRLGMSFLAALAASEPTVRQNMSQRSSPLLWETLARSMETSASVTQKALGSMVLRATADHSIGRSIIADNDSLVDLLVVGVNNDDEHPAIRANLLDILSQLLHDFPLKRISDELDQVLMRMMAADEHEHDESPSNLSQALTEVVAMKRWWGGHRKEIPKITPVR